MQNSANDSEQDREILFIADDFGMSSKINAAILRAHLDGALHGTCLMMGQPDTDEAIELAHRHPTLQIGWHLHLNDSQPLTVTEWPWGNSPAKAGLAMTFFPAARSLARAELAAQWQALKKTGIEIRYVNAHHHIHLVPVIRKLLVNIIAADPDFAGWLRWGQPCFFADSVAKRAYGLIDSLLQAPSRKRMPIRSSSTLWGLDRTFAMNAQEIESVLPELGAGLHEFMFHPRSSDPTNPDADMRCLLALRDRFTAHA